MTKPTFDAFKVAFLDPESRLHLNSQNPGAPAGEIVSMTISGGYLDGVEIAFSRHLNTVIGGRGTGKSTLLECLRYVLDIPPKGKQAHKLHLEIIKENLGKASGLQLFKSKTRWPGGFMALPTKLIYMWKAEDRYRSGPPAPHGLV